MSEAAGIVGVLAEHRVNYSQRNIGGKTAETLRYTSCEGCDWLGGWHDEAGWETHVAVAVLDHLRAVAADGAVRDAITERVYDAEQNYVNDEMTRLTLTAFLAALGGDGGGMGPEDALEGPGSADEGQGRVVGHLGERQDGSGER